MQRLTEIALEKAITGVFSRPEVALWVGGSPDRQFSLIKRALKAGQVVRIHRGLYCLAAKYLRQGKEVEPLVLAQRVYGPSYISVETALSYHGWIPEAVYAVTSVSMDRSREFDTPMKRFSFTHVPQATFYAEVTRVEKGPGSSFLLASPLKALADYVYVHRRDWESARPVVESLRVDEGLLAGVEVEAFDTLVANYSSLRVRRFLNGLRKDLHR
jgi:phage terminase large subunit-like protein